MPIYHLSYDLNPNYNLKVHHEELKKWIVVNLMHLATDFLNPVASTLIFRVEDMDKNPDVHQILYNMRIVISYYISNIAKEIIEPKNVFDLNSSTYQNKIDDTTMNDRFQKDIYEPLKKLTSNELKKLLTLPK